MHEKPTSSSTTMSCPTDPPADASPLLHTHTDTDTRSPLRGPMITLYAGADPQPFHVHRDVICASSPYFRARCLSTTSLSNARPVLRFPEIASRDMHIFLTCLYRRFWRDPTTTTAPAPDVRDNAQLYVVSGVFGVTPLRAHAADAVARQLARETPASVRALAPCALAAHLRSRMDVVRLVYEGTVSDDDALRALLVRSVTAHMDAYYERGIQLGIDMDAYVVGFEKVPQFWRDLKKYVPLRGKSGG